MLSRVALKFLTGPGVVEVGVRVTDVLAALEVPAALVAVTSMVYEPDGSVGVVSDVELVDWLPDVPDGVRAHDTV